MILVLTQKQLIRVSLMYGLILFLLGRTLRSLWLQCSAPELHISESEVFRLIDDIIHQRNRAILQGDVASLAKTYDRDTRAGLWAYEHQVKKLKYLRNWRYKQGVEFTAIKSLVRLRRVQPGNERVRVTFLTSTEYRYLYLNQPQTVNLMRIGAYHSLELINKDSRWLIRREWYTDPFADALAMDSEQLLADRLFILAQQPRTFPGLNPRRLKAVAYADEYCGAAANDEQGFKYNPKYRNYNYSGGDCANFASQVLHEGGGFPKTSAWNYGRGASRAWGNAHAFNRYMLNSGRASRIAYGTYNQVLKASYQLLPGDYIAYQKKGKVTHISVVTGADSKGYTVTNSHNADRYRVPWDLGYGDKGIKFWLVRVHY
ncbi:MAG: amidase domain-containing protein [Firmicutes bacterium]|nr:amidase domain-containing protein [Bacillota bacterium]